MNDRFGSRAALDCFVSQIDTGGHTPESPVKQDPRYQAAKSGDAEGAEALVRDTLNDAKVDALLRVAGGLRPTIVSVHAYEDLGVNAIPEAFADELSQRLGWPDDDAIVQTNLVAHTGGRLREARPAAGVRRRRASRSGLCACR